MNKFAIILLALVGCVCAQSDKPADFSDEFSQIALATSDDVEKSQLPSGLKIFGEFCVDSRDFVFNDIKQITNTGASKAFGILFNLAETLGRTGLQAIETGNSRLSKQIASPDSAIEDASNNVEEILANGQSRVQTAQTQPGSFVEAFKAIVSATSSAVANSFNDKITGLKETLSAFGSISTLEAVCDKIDEYEQALTGQFEEYKSNVAKENAKYDSPQYELKKIPCITSTRLLRLNAICHFAKSAAPSVAKIWSTRAASRAETEI